MNFFENSAKVYLIKKVNPILERLVVDLVMNKPDYLVDYMIQWLKTNGKKIEQEFKLSPQNNAQPDNSDKESVDEDDDEQDIIDMEKTSTYKKTARTSVSAEVFGFYNKKENFQVRVIQKNMQQIHRIRERLSNTFMFQSLEEQDLRMVIGAMEEKKFKAGDIIIQQGQDADNLYVVDSGELDCFKSFKKGDNPKYLKTYMPGESFGELALLYNGPRAATIKSKSETVLFSLDRYTFNHIVKDAAIKKRSLYEEFLSKVDLLQDVDPYERLQIADALKSKKFKKNEFIVREGEYGDTFYFLQQGEAIVTKKNKDNEPPQVVYHYKPGDYFGELALLKNAPRAASVIAVNDVAVVYLDRNSFKRLLGPLDDILKRNFKKYEKFVQ